MVTKNELEESFGCAMVDVTETAYKGYIERNWNSYDSGYAHGRINTAGEALGMHLSRIIQIHEQQETMVRLGQ